MCICTEPIQHLDSSRTTRAPALTRASKGGGEALAEFAQKPGVMLGQAPSGAVIVTVCRSLT